MYSVNGTVDYHFKYEHISLGPIKEEGAIWSTQLPLHSSLGAIFCFGRGVKRTNGRSR